ncbi:MAG TPA: mechanosensitive ion channel family protein [Candidatus Woesearchaeota archaeon]|nr:mechanosensitive ion channel family protein [Candidatus Woesearchaeota archaeon]
MDVQALTQFLQLYKWDLIIVIGVILGLLTLGKLTVMIIKNKVKHLASKTESELDDLILHAVDGLVEIALFFLGLKIGISFTRFAELFPTQLDLIFYLAWVGLGTIIFIRVINVVLGFNKEKLGIGTVTFLQKLTTFLGVIIAAVIILDHFKVEISPIIASLGIAGLAVALALQDTLANFFTGIYITADQPIRPGDYIEIGSDVAGTVKSIGWRSTKIKTWDNNVYIIPNKKIGESIILNYNVEDPKISISLDVEASYKDNPEKVTKVLTDVASKIKEKMDECVKDAEPVVKPVEFKNSGILYRIILRVKNRGGKFAVRPVLVTEIYKAFKKHKITIPFTTYLVQLQK